ncbi:histamine H4 receptor-like [Babylonia areolata]|uniref:histamine H4 receptor-like n=1 Tax=Babylonia areolata TaxID=304850 RepID=UPI003FCF5AC7
MGKRPDDEEHTEPLRYTYRLPLTTKIVVSVLALLLTFTIVVFNSITILVFFRSPSLRQFGDYFIVNLAVSDIAVGIITFPVGIPQLLTEEWLMGPVNCLIWIIWCKSVITASAYNMCVISVDRYLSVTRPFRYQKRKSRRLKVVMLLTPWLIPFVFHTSFDLFRYFQDPHLSGKGQQLHCHTRLLYNTPLLLLEILVEFGIPFSVMVLVNLLFHIYIQQRSHVFGRWVLPTDTFAKPSTSKVRQCPELKVSSSQDFHRKPSVRETTFGSLSVAQEESIRSVSPPCRSGYSPPQTSDAKERRSRQMRSVTRSLILVVLAFAFLWIPNEVGAVVFSVCSTCVHRVLFEITFWLLWSHAAVNPLLYPLLHNRFRTALKKIVWRSTNKVASKPAF